MTNTDRAAFLRQWADELDPPKIANEPKPAYTAKEFGTYCSICNVHEQWCPHIQPPAPHEPASATPEKRRMAGNGTRNYYHGVDHDYMEGCEIDPKCVPLEPAPATHEGTEAPKDITLKGERDAALAAAKAQKERAERAEKQAEIDQRVIRQINHITGDDFCEDLDIHVAFHKEDLSARELACHEKLSLIYKIAHSHDRSCTCYEVHKDWRALADSPAENREK